MDDLTWRALVVTAKRGFIGASREDFFSEIRGVVYADLEKCILDLEKRGYVAVEWTGPSKFIVSVTDEGNAFVKEEYKRRLEEYKRRIGEQEAGA
jgi:DNA-binding PadR family transcriptional regulator